ncbi:uncharacterized protein LOC119085513 isoform X2 [Bradysia coprophila]|uniref:uncharacterized protein LOC119085513 isoform X2 n=1 Tax=Bradysia coprophila TaxID=38358 RepID=UPI00187DD976|nr:uncharacterized protein LOC119085513 isoform X2 [Bradysia coprophila]
MLRLSRFILCALIVISFLYKSVCSSHQVENDDPNFVWKNNNSKDVATLIDLFNLIHGDNDDSGHNYMQRESWLRSQRSTKQHPRHKRSINEIEDGSEEAYTDELLNSPLHQLDLGKIQKYPRIREFFIRNGNKRNLEFNPRLGRAVHNDDCVEIVRFRPPYAPRLGKRGVDNFSPRLGRHCSEFVDRRRK